MTASKPGFCWTGGVMLASVLLAAAVVRAQSPVIEPGAKAELLAGDFKFTEGPAADAVGNVYFTDQGVTVFDPNGKQIEHIAVDAPWTANVCFGGKDGRTLFITAMQNLLGLRMRVRGAGSQ